MSYCKYVKDLEENNLHKEYHDKHYGVRIENNNELFCRLVMEINQAGLSWDAILKKEVNFRDAYDNFDIKKVANYKEEDFDRLMNDPGIIRNRLKINAAIHNANIILNLSGNSSENKLENINVNKYKNKDASKNINIVTFRKWLDVKKENKELENTKDSVKTFKKEGFKFVGGEIINEFLMSLRMLPNGHDNDCEYYDRKNL